MSKRSSLYTVKVHRVVAGEVRSLTLQFTCYGVASDTARDLERRGFTVDLPSYHGTKIYRTPAEAVEDARFWLGDLPKAEG